ncbi:MAG TPA: universal stress protein [Gaiellaceae bacterium]
MTGSIICGVDNSVSARKAARVARALAGKLGLGLVFVRADEGPASEPEMSATAERLEELRGSAPYVDCGATWLVEAGDPTDCLLDAAKEKDAALIVVGSSSSRSMSVDLWRRAPCPVVVVPLGDEAPVNGNGDGRERVDDERDFAGGIARLGLGAGSTEFHGGIVRFGLGLREPGGL